MDASWVWGRGSYIAPIPCKIVWGIVTVTCLYLPVHSDLSLVSVTGEETDALNS